MKTKIIYLLILALNLAIIHKTFCQNKNEKFVAIELNNVLCGYSVINLYDSIIDKRECLVLKQNTFFNFYILGKDISQIQKFTYHIDKDGGNFIYHDNFTKQGDIELGGTAYVEGDNMRYVELSGKENIFDLPKDVILPNTQFYPYLVEDDDTDSTWVKKLRVYDASSGNIMVTEYTKIGEEKIEFAGKDYYVNIVIEKDSATGVINKFWINREDGMRLQMETSQKIKMYLTDSSVPKRISTGNWDINLFTKTNEYIKDIRAIRYMKVKVNMKTIPVVERKDLDIPGQKFSGRINENTIDGIFTIKQLVYNGKNSPAFPFDQSKYEFDNIFLKAEDNIESDDDKLISLARKITEGAESSWDATYRISQWVIENIEGSILDGTAKETLENGSGLCGAQSRLMVALCRTIGIPARVVWGIMYTKEYNGSFGVHGWCEVFIGNAGWIPLDVTLHEADYIDSGHIRLGILNTSRITVQGDTIEIMEYKSQ